MQKYAQLKKTGPTNMIGIMSHLNCEDFFERHDFKPVMYKLW